MDELRLLEIASLLRRRNDIDARIADLIGHPAEKGHLGEYLAAEVFDIALSENATQRGFDGSFRSGPFAGQTVNIKWYAKQEGLLDIGEYVPERFLVRAWPRADPATSRGTRRPWTISSVHVFDAGAPLVRLRGRGVKIGNATSVVREEWIATQVFPQTSRSEFQLDNEQIRALEAFAP